MLVIFERSARHRQNDDRTRAGTKARRRPHPHRLDRTSDPRRRHTRRPHERRRIPRGVRRWPKTICASAVSSIADSVNPLHITREAWRDVAKRAGTNAFGHRNHLLQPRRAPPPRRNAPSPTSRAISCPSWNDVISREYHAWDRDRLVIDTAHTSEFDARRADLRRRGLTIKSALNRPRYEPSAASMPHPIARRRDRDNFGHPGYRPAPTRTGFPGRRVRF